MGIGIFKRENWQRWRTGPYGLSDFKLDPDRDRWLILYMLNHCDHRRLDYAKRRFRVDEVAPMPVNIDDEGDEDYAPYIVLNEQVMREEDYWTLKAAIFESPDNLMRRFAFCRLTGYSWPPSDCDAYSYRTYECGLKRGVLREDIEDLCRELIRNNGPFAPEARMWLKRLPSIGDDVITAWASGATERGWDQTVKWDP